MYVNGKKKEKEKLSLHPWDVVEKVNNAGLIHLILHSHEAAKQNLWFSYERCITLNGFDEMRMWHGQSC